MSAATVSVWCGSTVSGVCLGNELAVAVCKGELANDLSQLNEQEYAGSMIIGNVGNNSVKRLPFVDGAMATSIAPELFDISGVAKFMPAGAGFRHPAEAVVLMAMTSNNFAQEGTVLGKCFRD